MIQSENITELLVSLEAVQSELPAMPKNTPAYGYKYADLDTITQTIKPILHEHGIAYLQSVSGSSQEQMTLTTRIFNTKGQYIEDTAALPVITSAKNNAAQTLGMSITYMRRYALCAMLGITSDEDVDANAEGKSQPQKQTPKPTIPQKQQAKEAPQGFTPKGGEATPDERKQLDNLFRAKHPNGQPVFTRDDIKAFSAMRKDKTASELIAIVYNEAVERCKNDEPPRKDLY